MAARSLNLFIGCGGSGLATLTSLNRLLAQNKGTLPRLDDEVYYLAVDTDSSALDNFERDIREQTGTSPAPFIQRVHLLEGIGDWTEAELHDRVMEAIPGLGMKNGQFLWPLRIAISGQSSTPGGAFEIAYLLGREETLRRLKAALERL